MITELSRDLCTRHKERFYQPVDEISRYRRRRFLRPKGRGRGCLFDLRVYAQGRGFSRFLSECLPFVPRCDGDQGDGWQRFFAIGRRGWQFPFYIQRDGSPGDNSKVGEMVDMGWGPGRITGFIGDVALTSLREEEQNIAFCVSPDNKFQWLSYAYIRLRQGADATKAVGTSSRGGGGAGCFLSVGGGVLRCAL